MASQILKKRSAQTEGVSEKIPDTFYTSEDFNDETMEKVIECGNDLVKITKFEEELKLYMENVPVTEHLNSLASYVKTRKKILNLCKDKARAADAIGLARVKNIDFKIKSNKMKYWRDYEKFEKRVDDLFQWHKTEKNGREEGYAAPYFAMVQSSGMGKTKLLYEYKKRHEGKCLLIVCQDPYVAKSKALDKEVFDDVLLIETTIADFEKERVRIRKTLEGMITSHLKDLKDGDDVVLLLDEAQFLVKENEGFAFRVIRWWLRWNVLEYNVVLALAGTNSNLWNFLQEDAEVSSYSRDPKGDYNDGKLLYPPFFELSTIGLERKTSNSGSGKVLVGLDEKRSKVFLTDFDNAVKFGRPLFAYMAADEPLEVRKLEGILRRILIGKRASDAFLPPESCLSVLGTRVQMGQTTLQVSSELVAHGYACLTNFSTSTNLAHICFYPDPVCAYLAMNLMLPTKKLTMFGNRDPKFWTTEGTKIFATGLCRPGKGDVGEVTAALYLLFCGDVLRASNADLKVFAVSLCDMMRLSAKPNFQLLEESEAPIAHVSFIQVCRNYLRHSVRELSLASNGYLKEWFRAGCAFYAHPFCEGYDIIAPVRVVKKNEDFYYPMLVSVKNQIRSTPKERTDAVTKMTKILESTVDKVGVCVLLLIGLPPRKVVIAGKNKIGRKAHGTKEAVLIEETFGKIIQETEPIGLAHTKKIFAGKPHGDSEDSLSDLDSDYEPSIEDIDVESEKTVIDTDKTVLQKIREWERLMESSQADGSKKEQRDLKLKVEKKGNREKILHLTIVVPEDDCFGCWNMAVQGTFEGSEAAEILASHSVVHQTAGTQGASKKAKRLMRSKSKQVVVLKEYIEKYQEMANDDVKPFSASLGE